MQTPVYFCYNPRRVIVVFRCQTIRLETHCILGLPRFPYPVSMSATESSNLPSPWYAAYPTPKTQNPTTILREDVLEMLKQGKSVVGKDFILIDLRRNDHEVRIPRRRSVVPMFQHDN